MEDYNRLISSRILDGYDEMLDKVPQETMFGGKRARKFVLPSSTEYDYPSSLSVGTMDGKRPATLAGAEFKEFNRAFPNKNENLKGGMVGDDSDEELAAITGSMSLKDVGADDKSRPSAPFRAEVKRVIKRQPSPVQVKELVKRKASPVNNVRRKDDSKGGAICPAGNPRRVGGKFNLGKSLKSVGKKITPVAKDLGMVLAKEGIKEGVKTAAKGGKRRKKGVLHSVGKALSAVGKEVLPVVKETFHEVVVPEGKAALKRYLQNLNKKGGALIKNEPDEFQQSVYPPALASYAAQMPKGKDAYGRGRAKLPESGAKRNSARGAIVAEIMKKKGLSLGEASKYVKEKNLY